AARDRGEPRARVRGRPRRRPLREGVDGGLLREILREADVARHAGQRRDDTSTLDAPHGINGAGDVGHDRDLLELRTARGSVLAELGAQLVLAPLLLLLDVLVVREVGEVCYLG